MIFNFNFDDLNDIREFELEIKESNNIQTQRVQVPYHVMQNHILNVFENAARSYHPFRVRLIGDNEFWSQYENKFKKLKTEIQFANNAYIKQFPEEFKGE